MSKQQGVSKFFLTLTAGFTEMFEDQALELALLTLSRQRDIKNWLNKRALEMLGPVIDDYFRDGIAVSNQLVKRDVARLADDIGLPVKYNRDLLETINGKSAFTGYYDTDAKGVFKRSEIDKIKKTILQGKYGEWSDRELQAAIKSQVNTTNRRALVIARQETARLNSAATQIYYENSKVNKEYDKVWVAQPDARPTHKAYDGQVADEDGYFDGPEGRVIGPPIGFGCRCRVVLRKKQA
jgi:SPP1 gp7 family putative phage head morphogenesis protein